MAFSFKLFEDAGLTTEKVGNLVVQQNSDGSTPPVDNALYLGSVDVTRKLQDAVSPGVASIIIDVVDATPGVDHLDTEVKLATTLLGLDSATPGASLTLSTEILGGVPGAQPIFVRVDDATGATGTSTELSFETSAVIELAV